MHVNRGERVSKPSLLYLNCYVSCHLDAHFFMDIFAATLGAELARYRLKARFYIGCMKSGLFLLGMRYHEPEYWKFGEEGGRVGTDIFPMPLVSSMHFLGIGQ